MAAMVGRLIRRRGVQVPLEEGILLGLRVKEVGRSGIRVVDMGIDALIYHGLGPVLVVVELAILRGKIVALLP
jgi:hypothetical protein